MSLSNDERKKIISGVVNKLKKKYGQEFIVDPDSIPPITPIPSGSLKLDNIIGIGGWPRRTHI